MKEEREKNAIIYKHPDIEGISLEERRNNDKTFLKSSSERNEQRWHWSQRDNETW